ncbi:probable auxin efflux carrier component 5c isoform X1 [Sorghum bicolor]|uniref:probable auxin efflux carrier component 5c isoform X1 n=1 Tax=Sorghum bicolor TaxID=4558 RepID=UPI000B423CCD|nr:probable auxin efflux carrier component 5c isoform X1 [Sorghum bicolor]|eukprot:XP_021320085.1 probable auxin efflux carrier component 5c isoform X1 [Sorghum bicolor]
MIPWGDIYKVVAAMAPLYFALGLGYGSVRWWRFFTAEQCAAINTLVVNFSMPFFTFDFLARANPYTMNYRVLAADAVSKALAIAAVSAWGCCCRGGKAAGAQAWAITGFSLAGFNNTLVVGVPLLYAMYGKWAQDLIVQIAVVQSLFWFPLLLLGFELRKAWWVGGGGRVGPVSSSSASSSSPPPSPPPKKDAAAEKDVEMNAEETAAAAAGTTIRLWPLVRTVGLKLAGNPNVYASVLGVVWACIAYRYVRGTGIVTGSLDVMSKTGTGMSMLSMGLFMAQQEKMIACGSGLAALGMALRFVAGPLATLVGAAAFRLRGDVLRFAIIQAALPQSIASFVFAKEYGLHADVLSTAVIFGTLVSLPVLIAYYAVLGIL